MLTLPSELTSLIVAFAPLFSKPVWQHVQVLLVGAILAPGKRTVTAALRVMGLSQERHFQTYHRVLNRAEWSSRAASRILLSLLIKNFAPTGALVFALDDTIERRRGEQIAAKGIYRDPVRSSHSHFVKASGLRWLCLMLTVRIPWAQRVWALPVLTCLCPSERYYKARGRPHKKLTQWAAVLQELPLSYYPTQAHPSYPSGIIILKQDKSSFKWRHFEPTLILLCVRWYCRYQLSYRDLEEMMNERGLTVDHTTVWRWVQRYASEINKRIRPYLKMSGTSYRVDETYIKVGKSCKYLYRAVDKEGQTIEFQLSAKRDVAAAKRFFQKIMRADHRRLPFSISVDKNAAYPEAFTTSQEENLLPMDCQLRRVKYLNNIIEQDHRFIKKKVRASQCFKSFHTAARTLEGIEAANMMRKGQVKRLSGNDAMGQAKFVASLFQIAP